VVLRRNERTGGLAPSILVHTVNHTKTYGDIMVRMHPLFWEVDAFNGTKRQVTSKLSIFAVEYIIDPEFTMKERSAEDEEESDCLPRECGPEAAGADRRHSKTSIRRRFHRFWNETDPSSGIAPTISKVPSDRTDSRANTSDPI